ncbi:MAG: type I DNA topoisomerase [Sandaracinaceae bacterium]|nr:type I DNA topoisomerase [Sandaracinaceae bacterium]
MVPTQSVAVSKSLVIVESPAKARTIARYLGDDYVVESSIGHIRDLPGKTSEVPEELRDRFARKDEIGVDVQDDFKPLYLVDPDKKSHISMLKKLLKDADTLYLATDEDREGESIAWHLLEVLKPKVPVKRMVFHEITKKAIQEAIEQPRELDRRLVDAQEARRILDRLYGYSLSPVLWRRVMPRLSAGRVQSVATRIIVERERQRIAFVKASYWDLTATFHKGEGAEGTFEAKLTTLDGSRLASGKDFGSTGTPQRDDVVVLDEPAARALADDLLAHGRFTVDSVERKPYRRKPAAPFMTSTLQQEASRKLRMSARQAMSTAQRLYEAGYITYMRTDSTTLSETALNAARTQIEELYGASYVPAAPRTYPNKVKNAQEAHEAIRPAGDAWKKPEVVARELDRDQARLYELIWKRTIASQMEDALGETLSVKIGGRTPSHQVELSVSGRTITFPGFLRAYVEGSDDPDAELEDKEKHLPPLAEGEGLRSTEIAPEGHETQPPPRFTEASLVRALEELGVGRPSTYASIISTIDSRGYVFRKGSALVPSFTAFAVVGLLEKHFAQLVDYAFTAKMEDELDGIASGAEDVGPWLSRFYHGPEAEKANLNGKVMDVGLKRMVNVRLDEIDAREINSLPIGVDPEGRAVVLRVGRFGPYLERSDGARASVPEDQLPDELTLELGMELLEKPSDDRALGEHPETGETIFAKAGRWGPYVQLGEAGGDRKEKPKTASLFKSMSLETLTFEDALKLLTLPREVGFDDADGELIVALNGRYGPYIQKGKETRSLEREEQIFTVTVEEAKKLLAEPKRRGRAASSEPLRTLDNDPVSGQPITVREGRYGPYVTDGESIQSLLKGDTIEGMTTERAAELLARRRERGPSKKRPRKAAAKKATAKKAPAKKAAKKKTAKKKASKKKTAKKKAASKKAD